LTVPSIIIIHIIIIDVKIVVDLISANPMANTNIIAGNVKL
jgi:hypothetical protein